MPRRHQNARDVPHGPHWTERYCEKLLWSVRVEWRQGQGAGEAGRSEAELGLDAAAA